MSWMKWVGLAVGLVLAPVTAGGSLALTGTTLAYAGIGLGIGYWLDEDKKKRDNESKAIEQNTEITKQIRDEITNLQDERSQEASKLNNLEQQQAQKETKLNDPNTPESEKAQIRSEIASIISQRGSAEKRIKELDEKIANLIKANPGVGNANENNTSLPKIGYEKMLMIGGAILIVYLIAKDKDK